MFGSTRIPQKPNDSEQGAPNISQTKPNTNRVNLLSYFRNLNEKLKHKPYPTPKTSEILLKSEGF